jgi:hypothetical protein
LQPDQQLRLLLPAQPAGKNRLDSYCYTAVTAGPAVSGPSTWHSNCAGREMCPHHLATLLV